MTADVPVRGVEFRYCAFLSYSHRDRDWADWLQRALEGYSIPPRLVGLATPMGRIPARFAPVFRDRDELPSATDLGRKVSEALAQSASMIVVCSPHAAQSRWVDEEIRSFLRLGRNDRVFCLIVDGEPGASGWPGRAHDECFPPSLRERASATPDPVAEPIAADVRPHRDGRATARLKLVAGLLGVDLGDLRHRERERRRRRAIALAGSAVALLTLTTVLAVNAVIARHAAERREKQAEDLVGFMLGDLDDKLREVNRLDILESVADKVVKHFDALPPADLTDDTLAQRARALLKLGAVRRDEGRVAAALESFDDALATSTRLVEHAPANADYLAINAETLTWLGFIDWSQGMLDRALSRFTAARDILLRVSALRPEDIDVLDRLGAARTNAGRVFEARGQLDDARREYAEVLDGYRYLARREPERLEWRTELGYAHNNLAQLALKEGRLEDAVKEYLADREIKANLFGLDPTNNARREDLVASEAFLGRVLFQCGETRAAETHLRAAMDGIETLLGIDANATDWVDKAGSYGWMLGQVRRVRGDAAEAERRDLAAVARMRQLVLKDGRNVGWQRKLAQAEIENARRLLGLRRLGAAAEAAAAARKAAQLALASAGEDIGNRLVAAEAALVDGDIADAAGDAKTAAERWTSARAAVGEDALRSKDPAMLDLRVGLALRLGEAASATPVVETLAGIGYRDADFLATLARYGVAEPPASAATNRIAEIADDASPARESVD